MNVLSQVTYASISFVIFIIEILIVNFIPTGFVRHTLGDLFVVILLYTTLRAIFRISIKKGLILSLGLCLSIEILQLFSLSKHLNLNQHLIGIYILGSTFSYVDLMAYIAGGIAIYTIEQLT